MGQLTTREQYNPTLDIRNAHGDPAPVDGVPVWATSDATVVSLVVAADGMSAVAASVATGGPARITCTADADMGAGVRTLTVVSEDITVVLDPSDEASVMTLTLGPPGPKAPVA
jgi:hypothetical protein